MSRPTIVRYLRIVAILTAYAFVIIISNMIRRIRKIGSYVASLAVRTKCFLEDKLC